MLSPCVSIAANPSAAVWRLRKPVVMGGRKSGGSDEVDASPPSRGNVVWSSPWKTALIMMNVFLLLLLLILAPMILKLRVEFERLETELDERIESMEKTLISWDRLERDEVREIIEKEIAKHAADGIGRVDYAVASGGGRVLKHSEPSVLGSRLSRWISGNVHRDAVKMLQPSFGQTGECFPLKGDNGFVEIKLCTTVVPEAITVEHVAKNWLEEEEEKLAVAWVSVSEDVSNGVSRDFWGRVRNVFHDLMGCPSRNLDEICSKYRDMRVKCREFVGIYNSVINNGHEGDIDPVTCINTKT